MCAEGLFFQQVHSLYTVEWNHFPVLHEECTESTVEVKRCHYANARFSVVRKNEMKHIRVYS